MGILGCPGWQVKASLGITCADLFPVLHFCSDSVEFTGVVWRRGHPSGPCPAGRRKAGSAPAAGTLPLSGVAFLRIHHEGTIQHQKPRGRKRGDSALLAVRRPDLC